MEETSPVYKVLKGNYRRLSLSPRCFSSHRRSRRDSCLDGPLYDFIQLLDQIVADVRERCLTWSKRPFPHGPYGSPMSEYRDWVKVSLFLSSYIPLWLAMALKMHPLIYTVYGVTLPWLSIGFLVLTVFSGVILWQAIGLRQRREPKFYDIESYRNRHDLLTSYLIAYIFPFINLDYTSWVNWAIFGIFFVVLAAIQIRSTHLHVNPVLTVFGYNIYEVEGMEKGTNILVAEKGLDLERETVRTVELSKRVYITVAEG